MTLSTLPLAYKLILALVPFVSIIVGGWLCGGISDKTAVGRFLDSIAEKDLESLMRHNGFSSTSVKAYQITRLVLGFVGCLILTGVMGFGQIRNWLLGAITLVLVYKVFYFYLQFKDSARIKRLNTVLPYTIKSISYLASVYPVNNALLKSVDIVPKEFQEDLRILCEDIDDDPTTFAPYQAFIDRYDGRLNHLDYYLKTLYRMSVSATKEEARLLSNLNETISNEMSVVRQQKNNAINNTVTYLGLIPVGLLTIMLMFLMVAVGMQMLQ